MLARRENRSKIIPNARLDRVARRIVFESCFFELRSVKMASRGVSGAFLGALERLLGRSWALLGRSWALLVSSWGALGALLGRSWALLEGIWDALGDLGRSWLGSSRGENGSWMIWTRFWTLRGSILEPQGVYFRRVAGRQTDTCCEAKA